MKQAGKKQQIISAESLNDEKYWGRWIVSRIGVELATVRTWVGT